MESKEQRQIKQSEIVRNRKRMSRSNESCMTNGLVVIFITHVNATVTFRKTKKSKATVKMYLPESINLNGIQHDEIALRNYSNEFMKTIMGEEPVDISQMDEKQFNRSKEAQINNGLLYLLHKLGFTFHIKQTKKSTKTEKLVKISMLKTPTNQEFPLESLEKIGLEFSKVMEEIIGRDKICLSRENFPIERFPQLMIEENTMIISRNQTETGSFITSNSAPINQMNQQEIQSPIVNNICNYYIPQQNGIQMNSLQYPNNDMIYSLDNEQQMMIQQQSIQNNCGYTNVSQPQQFIPNCYYFDANHQKFVQCNIPYFC